MMAMWCRCALVVFLCASWGTLALRPSVEHEAAEAQDRLKPDTIIEYGNSLYMAQGKSEDPDGPLTERGESDVLRRIELQKDPPYKTTHLALFAKIEEVWVAPMRGSMATSMIAVAKAWSLLQSLGGQDLPEALPRFVVKRTLRNHHRIFAKDGLEKLNEDIKAYLQSIATKYASSLLGSETALDGVVKDLTESYAAEALRSSSTGVDPQPWDYNLPTNVMEAYANAHALKLALGSEKKTVMLVSDRDYGTYLFMPLLPAAGSEDMEASLKWGYREVLGLASASLLNALWARVSPCPPEYAPDETDPNFALPYFQTAEYGSAAPDLPILDSAWTVHLDDQKYIGMEVNEQGRMVNNAEWWTFVMRKKKKHTFPGVKFLWTYGRWHQRIIHIGVMRTGHIYDHKGYISWSKLWGNLAKGYLPLLSMQAKLLDDGTVEITSPSAEWVFDAGSESSNREFVNILAKAQKTVPLPD
mmetsp:Transcript_22904/g.42086  ORF Transcript_22904/g.42086 Transcript_22904/m.42086 type:complete len:472 (+) Transcript_22904:103-1518(+)